MTDEGLWILTEDEHQKLAYLAYCSFYVADGSLAPCSWNDLPSKEKRGWLNAVAGLLLYALSDKHGMDAVVIDYD